MINLVVIVHDSIHDFYLNGSRQSNTPLRIEEGKRQVSVLHRMLKIKKD